MEYSPYNKGISTEKRPITIETPPYEWDSDCDAGVTYIRYEKTDKQQYMERVLHDVGRYEMCYAVWTNRTDPGIIWSPIAFDRTLYV